MQRVQQEYGRLKTRVNHYLTDQEQSNRPTLSPANKINQTFYRLQQRINNYTDQPAPIREAE